MVSLWRELQPKLAVADTRSLKQIRGTHPVGLRLPVTGRSTLTNTTMQGQPRAKWLCGPGTIPTTTGAVPPLSEGTSCSQGSPSTWQAGRQRKDPVSACNCKTDASSAAA